MALDQRIFVFVGEFARGFQETREGEKLPFFFLSLEKVAQILELAVQSQGDPRKKGSWEFALGTPKSENPKKESRNGKIILV